MCRPDEGRPISRSPSRDLRPVEQLRPVHDAHDRAREVVVALGVHPRHLRRLAAEERAAVLAAGEREALEDFSDDLGPHLPRRDVVEEEERTRALDEDVVHAMVDEILSDRAVDSRGDRDLHLRADAVGRSDEERVGHPGEIRAEEAAEAPDVADDALRERGADRLLRAGDGAHLRVDVDAGVRVGQRAGVRHGADRSRALRHRTAAS